MTDNVCNYQSNSHAELMKNQSRRSAPHPEPLVPPEWWWAINEASLDAAAALTGTAVIKTTKGQTGGGENYHYHKNACQSNSDVALISMQSGTQDSVCIMEQKDSGAFSRLTDHIPT